MNTFCAPAVALLNRLSYPRKFTLISLLFLLPLMLVMSLLINEINNRIAFGSKELVGNAYLRPVRHLLEDVTHHGQLAIKAAHGDDAARTALAQRRSEIEANMAALAAIEREHGATLQTADLYASLSAAWTHLDRDVATLTPDAVATRHRLFISDLRALMAHVGDQSNLILDPDLDSYYLMDAVLLKLPEQHDLLAQTLFLSGRLPDDYRITASEKAEMTILAGRLRANVDALNTGLHVAQQQNTLGNLASTIPQPLNTSAAVNRAFAASVEGRLLAASNGYRDTFDTEGAEALNQSFALWDRTSVELDRVLHYRIDNIAQQRTLVVTVSTIMLALVLYLLIAFYRSVMSTVAALELAAQRLVSGDTTTVVDLATRDELGQVARSFNQIATAMVEASVQRQAVVDHAADAIVTLDQDGTIRSFNPAATRMFGFTAAEIVGQPVARLMPQQHGEAHDWQGARHELIGQRQDGTQFPIELALGETNLGAQRHTIAIVRDVSERVAAEEERARLQARIIDTQASALAELSSPLIPVSDHVIVMPLIGNFDAQRGQQITETLLSGVEHHRAAVAIVDVTGVPTVDVALAHAIVQAARAVRLLGADVVLTGIRPQVAQTLVALGADLRDLVTRSTLQSGIAYALGRGQRVAVVD